MWFSDNRMALSTQWLFQHAPGRLVFTIPPSTTVYYGVLASGPSRYTNRGFANVRRDTHTLTVPSQVPLTKDVRIVSGSTSYVVVGVLSQDQYTTTVAIAVESAKSQGNVYSRENNP